MYPPLKYQPYAGTGRGKPWYWYGLHPNGAPQRIRTRGDWRFNGPTGGNWKPVWWRCSDDAGSVYQKQATHRDFRRQAKRMVARELAGDDAVSHAFRAYGDYLD